MNVLDTVRGLMRRWYLVIPGMGLAFAAALGLWTMIDPPYERTASQLLLPGTGTLPEGASNPYLYLGGLTAPADVLVRAAGSADELRSIFDEHPSAEIEITRDPAASGPVVLTKVTGPTDAAAGEILTKVTENTAKTLEKLQEAEKIPAADRVTISTVSADERGIPQQRNRIIAAGGAGLGLFIMSLLIASLVDGFVMKSRRRESARRRWQRDERARVSGPQADTETEPGESSDEDEDAPSALTESGLASAESDPPGRRAVTSRES